MRQHGGWQAEAGTWPAWLQNMRGYTHTSRELVRNHNLKLFILDLENQLWRYRRPGVAGLGSRWPWPRLCPGLHLNQIQLWKYPSQASHRAWVWASLVMGTQILMLLLSSLSVTKFLHTYQQILCRTNGFLFWAGHNPRSWCWITLSASVAIKKISCKHLKPKLAPSIRRVSCI